MEELNPVFLILTIIVFAIAFPTALYSWFKMITAKTSKDYWKYIALFIFPILIVFVFAYISGMMPSHEELAKIQADKPPAEFQQVFSNTSISQKILFAAAGLVWIGGGNLLFYFHKKRLNKSWWEIFNPLRPPMRDFNTKEWNILILLVILTFVIFSFSVPSTETLNKSHNKTNIQKIFETDHI